ncbi:MAG: hypothetical protein E7386_05720 [Ruminococcaceae bacterium]|nr:hypothetical protein [Oscillospiraceae bacterium]
MTENSKTYSKKKIIIIVAASVLVLAAAVVAVVFARQGYLANTMRLLKVEGTVNIEDSKGESKPVINNIRFQSGDALNTGEDGLASVGLDASKIVTLNNNSRAEFSKKGKQLELKLTKGSLFLNVTEKLKPDEKFEIKTSNMTCGIRGTSAVIYYDQNDDMRETIAVTDGTVEISATNPKTGETKTAKVEAGKQLKVYFYTTNEAGTSIEFYVIDLTEEDLSEFTLTMIAENDELIKRICDHTGWDPDKLKKTLKDLDAQGKGPTGTVPTVSEPTKTDPEPTEPEPTEPEESPGPSATNSTKKKKKKTPKATTKTVTKPPAIPKKIPYKSYEKWVWNTKTKKFVLQVFDTSDDGIFKGYLNGKWITLTFDPETEKFTYRSSGKTKTYCYAN